MRIKPWLFPLLSVFPFSTLLAQSVIDYKNYQEVFRDDFTYTKREELSRNWRFVSPDDPDQGWGDEYFTPEQVSLRSDRQHRHTGLLRLSARRLPVAKPTKRGEKLFVSGKIESKVDIDGSPSCNGMYPGLTYGMIEIRCKLPKGRNGIWPTFWFLSSDTEIDIIDNLKPEPDQVIQSGVIDWRKTLPNDSTTHVGRGAILSKPDGLSLSASFNTYTAVWTPTEVSFFFNGRHLYDVADTAVVTHPCAGMLLATLQMKNYDETVMRAHMDIDYIRVLKPLDNNYTLSYTKDADELDKVLRASFPNVSSAVGALVVNPMMPEKEVFYRGDDDELYHALRHGKHWQVQSLHKLANLQQPDYLVQGNLSFEPRKGVIMYQGRNGRTQLFNFNTSWHHSELPIKEL